MRAGAELHLQNNRHKTISFISTSCSKPPPQAGSGSPMCQPHPELMSYSGTTGRMRGGAGDFAKLKPDILCSPVPGWSQVNPAWIHTNKSLQSKAQSWQKAEVEALLEGGGDCRALPSAKPWKKLSPLSALSPTLRGVQQWVAKAMRWARGGSGTCLLPRVMPPAGLCTTEGPCGAWPVLLRVRARGAGHVLHQGR